MSFATRQSDWLLVLLVVAIGGACAGSVGDSPAAAGAGNGDVRQARQRRALLPVFQIVNFPNDPCDGGSNRNGTCYTAEECDDKGGTNSGSCASGYGVCCTFTLSCGDSSAENCTYFQSTGSEIGQCSITVCPCNDNICQLRLDFNSFTITGPSTATTSDAKALNGVPLGAIAAGQAVTPRSQCLTDVFSVSSPSGSGGPSPICGQNIGEHMYVDASDACNELNFQLGTQGLGTGGITTRQWNIKITQYSCDSTILAPDGCTQYFYGVTGTDTVMTYNFQGGQHLDDQDQNICVRRERSMCRICWTTVADADFAVGGTIASMGVNTQSKCCGYGSDGSQVMGGDCAVIPGALTGIANMMTVQGFPRICGNGLGLTTKSGNAPATVCTTREPFNIRFLSDSTEFEAEAAIANAGFQLTYIQDAINC